MKVRQVLQLLSQDGWILKATKGSHRQFVHPLKSGKVTLPGHPSDELSPGTWNSIRKQAGWK
jgi:predicted RNA binding protein YcfA (HicA-like mRNA interferase family)